MDFNEDNKNETSPTNFLSMPDLDPEPKVEKYNGIELLGEFHINNDNDDITRKSSDKNKEKDSESNFLNCVLPSINTDQNDDASGVSNFLNFH